MDYKGAPLQVKDLDAKEGIVISYPSTFGVKDAGDDIIHQGAFAKTIAEWGPGGKNRIKALFDHEPAWLVGRPLKLTEDATGLLAETKFGRTGMARDTLSLIEDGIITEQSIGFKSVKHDPVGKDGIRHLREVKLFEYSFLAWGLNEHTPILGLKGPTGVRDRALKSMAAAEKALRDGSWQTDEVPHLLEVSLKRWQAMLKQAQEDEAAQRAASSREGGRIEVTTKASDFQTILTTRQRREDLREDWWDFTSALRTAMAGVALDPLVTDKAAAVGASLDQFKAAMLLWFQSALEAQFFAAEKSAPLEFVAAGLRLETKDGRRNSAADLDRIKAIIQSGFGLLDEADKTALLAALGGTSEPPKQGTQGTDEPPEDEKKALAAINQTLEEMRRFAAPRT